MTNANTKTVENPIPKSLEGGILTIETKKPLPPGSRVNATIDIDPKKTVGVEGKIISINAAGNSFTVRIRLHSVTKQDETALVALLSTS